MLAKLHRILEEPGGKGLQRWVPLAIQTLIVLNVAAVVLETVQSFAVRFGEAFRAFELFSVAVFSIEYVVRLVSSVADPRYRRPVLGRARWAATPLAIVDLLAILPAYLPFLFGADLRVLRAVRLMRVFRILKLGRYSRAVRSLGRALSVSAAELGIVLFGLVVLLVLASSIVYYAEREAQPEGFSSIPAAAWWGVATVTTVGYGDLVPVTPLGKLAASIMAILGIGLFALPAGILGSAFVAQLRGRRDCPHCGQPLE